MSKHQDAKAQLLIASFEVGQAQRALEEAEKRFREALNAVESFEGLSFPRPHSNTPE